ncbi:MAG TPA: RagB/SusD family nutrient uptake outer membrane protein [Pedobacter sp.]|uniref:RagB/SusD family nutrient uptake outer membrane protein n=1 Tax=Pedobacter sp. TaxID=1411316 RepID=UPI002C670B26|nr:RagB/SusD family nutrient uptake outer membrane protein [Pedobacter sp.]HMI05646.1 RagB/SusD family nutrient uptake outer membrane protein [Pedobacter sp.]
MKRIIIFCTILVMVSSVSCKKYLDIVPDNVATLENAFAMRNTAEQFLFTCYSYMPLHGNDERNPALAAGDEFWRPLPAPTDPQEIAKGNQRIVDPYMNFWEGLNGGTRLFGGIRDCNIFLENIGVVPDMEQAEKDVWIAEIKALKAYYHFYLFRLYGPVPLIRQNLPISAGVEEVQIKRSPSDECINYIVELLDEAAPDLPPRIINEVAELGRFTRSIALALKAEVLMTAASPLFNGNVDYTGIVNKDGEALFNTTYDKLKWNRAADALKMAIDFCEAAGYKLYEYKNQYPQYAISPVTIIQMSIRNSVCEPWNSEVIWGDINSRADAIQNRAAPRGLDPASVGVGGLNGNIAIPLKIVEMFYSNNGVPVDEDKNWDYANRFRVKTGDTEHKYVIREGYQTAELNFKREQRFYADLGFDGGIWYGQGKFDDKGTDLLFVSSKKGNPASEIVPNYYSASGYWPKKLFHFQNIVTGSLVKRPYPWPVIKLSNLYLFYAEALNEIGGPQPEVFSYVDLIRKRAGLLPVKEAWTTYSRNPNKFNTQEGLREIIHRERLIEFAMEGQRFWDLRRWKQATTEMNKSITGWDINKSTASLYYRETFIYNQKFSARDYLWPINENELLKNGNLIQNPGW